MNITHLGLFAGAITSAAAVPQIIKTFRTRHARDISLWQLILLNLGMTLWLIYGVALGDIPLILANTFSILCYIILTLMKIRYSEDDKKSIDGYSYTARDIKEEL